MKDMLDENFYDTLSVLVADNNKYVSFNMRMYPFAVKIVDLSILRDNQPDVDIWLDEHPFILLNGCIRFTTQDDAVLFKLTWG